jgi:multicomponent Na+:H+ antiporter subunit C
MVEFILGRYNYWAIIALMMIGLYITYQSNNFIKKMVGLSIFQTSVFLFYITLGKVTGGTAAILYGRDWKSADKAKDAHADPVALVAPDGTPLPANEPAPLADAAVPEPVYGPIEGLYETYSNPLPHVLILTAIVVSVATLSLGLALIVRIREAYGSVEADEVARVDHETAVAEADGRDAAEGAV